MKKIKILRENLTFNIISAVVILLLLFGCIVSTIGYVSFTNAFKREYATTTYHMAATASMLINGDELDNYLQNGENAEYKESKEHLNIYCQKIHVSLIYIIKVDTSDYGRFVSVFNAVDNTVDNSNYIPWELGHKRDTTNDEYREKYKALYNKEADYETVYRTNPTDGQHPHITTLVPVKNSNDDVVAILCMQRPIRELNESRRPFLINVAVSTIILSIVVSLTYAGYIRREFVLPLHRVSDETVRFAKENKKGVTLGKVSKINDISRLALSIDQMEDDMIKYIDNLTAATSEKERLNSELSIAKMIQENSVPNIFPAYPDREDFDIRAFMDPAKEVGGDFYNFFLLDDDHLALVIADVSGKGIPASLFMMVTNILISDRTQMGGTPSEILTFVNESICQHNPADMFVTVWLGILEISSGKIIASNAGHEDPAVYRKDGHFELIKSKHSLVIGAMEGVKYTDVEIQLNKGDKIFLYTDGVPEATDINNNMMTLDGMIDALNHHKEESPENLLLSVKNSIFEFVGDAPQFDDITMVCLELKDYDNAPTITVDATAENLYKVMDFVDGFLENGGCPMKAKMQIDLSVEEIYINISNYAYGDSIGKAEVSVDLNNDEITIVFKDSGIPYDPLKKEEPNVNLPAEEREIGGLGIFLVNKNMDSLSYEYKDNKNILTMKKKF